MDQVRRIIDSDLETLGGWCTKEKAHALVDIIRDNDISRFLELGVYQGRSLIPIALAIKALNHDDPSSLFITGVDAWSSSSCAEGATDIEEDNKKWWLKINQDKTYKIALDNIKKYGLGDFVSLVRISSLDFHDRIGDQTLDMLHQDSNHSEFVTCREVDLYWNKLKLNGWWIFDDTNWSTTKAAQEKLETYGYACQQDHEGWKAYQRTFL